MTKKPSAAQLALLDQIAVHGYYTARQRKTAYVLIREGWIEQRPAPGEPCDGQTPWWITDAGSVARGDQV
jgi:hypothetical protein